MDCAITGRTDIHMARNTTNAVRRARIAELFICSEWRELDERSMKKLGKTKPRQSMTRGAMFT
jgi:hypothetical protein